MPPMIVAPEREVPGTSASACAQPTSSASVQRIASTESTRIVSGRKRCRRSAQRITSAPTTNATATGTGANRCALIAWPNSESEHRRRQERDREVDGEALRGRVGEESAQARRASRARYSQHTARIAPAWITISKVFACSPV